MTITDTTTRQEIDPTTGEPRCSHIVAGTDRHTGIELVMLARVEGVPVTALCGYTWVPSRDPKAYPLCSRCRDIREAVRPDQDPSEIPS